MSNIPYSVRGERRSKRGGEATYSAYGFFDIPVIGISLPAADAVNYITELKVKDSTTAVGMSIASGVITINEPGTYFITSSMSVVGTGYDDSGYAKIGSFSAFLVSPTPRPGSNVGVGGLCNFKIRSEPVEIPSYQDNINFMSGSFSGQTILITTVPNYQIKLGTTCNFDHATGTTVKLTSGATSLNIFKIL
jgi:hypothetical protein